MMYQEISMVVAKERESLTPSLRTCCLDPRFVCDGNVAFPVTLAQLLLSDPTLSHLHVTKAWSGWLGDQKSRG